MCLRYKTVLLGSIKWFKRVLSDFRLTTGDLFNDILLLLYEL